MADWPANRLKKLGVRLYGKFWITPLAKRLRVARWTVARWAMGKSHPMQIYQRMLERLEKVAAR